MRNFTFFILFLVLPGWASAQWESVYSSYPFNPIAVNPANTGSRDVTSMTLMTRRRSVLFRNTYSSPLFTIDSPVGEKWALGFQAFKDNYSVAGVGFYGSAAYRHRFSETDVLAVGAQIGVTQVLPPNTIYGNNVFPFSAGLGIQYRSSRYSVGLSAQNLVGGTDYYENVRPVFLTGAYLFDLSEDVKLKAAAQARGQQVASSFRTHLDLNATLWYRQLGVGFWYQNTLKTLGGRDGMLATVELQLGDKFRVGGSYDFNAKTEASTGLNSSESTLWQLFLRFEFDRGTGKVGQMRYF